MCENTLHRVDDCYTMRTHTFHSQWFSQVFNDLVKFIIPRNQLASFPGLVRSLLAVQNLCRICKWRTHKAWKQGFHINGQLFLLLLVFSLHFREAHFNSMLTWAYDEFESRAWPSSNAVVSGPLVVERAASVLGFWVNDFRSGSLIVWVMVKVTKAYCPHHRQIYVKDNDGLGNLQL